METVKEVDQDVAEESEEKGPPEDDPCRGVSYVVGLLAVGSSVDALLDLSAEYSMQEQEPCDQHSCSGWEEARRHKEAKSDEQDPHCLLCVDNRPPGFGARPRVNPHDPPGANNTTTTSTTTPPGLPTAPYAPAAGSPPWPSLGGHQHHLHPPRDKMADDTGLRDVLRPSQPHHLNSKLPVLKSLPGDLLGLHINSFTVLPPVKTPQWRSQRPAQQPGAGESGSGSAGGGSATGEGWESGAAAPPAAGEGRGVERTEETGGAATATCPEPSEDTYRAIVAPPPPPHPHPPPLPPPPPAGVYCQSQEERHLLATFTVPILRRYRLPLGKISNSVHRTTVSLGKHWKQAVRSGSEYSRHERSTTPQLPVLLGTKVPIVVSSQRPL